MRLWAHPEINREAPLFERAIDLGEARRAHPFELIGKRRASVVPHPIDRTLILKAI